jgi:elongation factor Ts
MADITAEMVRTLREETGAGMMDCKRALTETNGDMDAARVVIRKKGQDKAVSKQSRTASEGIVEAFTSEAGDVGVLVELNCETDFVARGDAFRNLAAKLARIVAAAPSAGSVASVDALLGSVAAEGSAQTVREMIVEASLPIGEKIELARFERYDTGSESQAVGAYIHRTDFKTGVLVEVNANKPVSDMESLEALAREIALHVAAASPQFVSREAVPAHLIEQERDIAVAKMNADPKFENKPEQAKTAMIEGQIRKYLEQSVLLDQAFVRDPSGKQRVRDLVAETGKKVGAEVTVARFARYRVGESQAAKTDEAVNA